MKRTLLLFIFLATCDHVAPDVHPCFCEVGDLACDGSELIVCDDNQRWMTLTDCRDLEPGQYYCCEPEDEAAKCCEAKGENR